jgi:hypothetical protein
MKRLAYIVVLMVFLSEAKAQTTIVNYTFENTTAAIVGTSISSVSWTPLASATYASTFSSQGQALSLGSFTIGDSFKVTLDATGFQNIVFGGFRINGTPSAPVTWQLSYSLTGASGTFTNVAPFTLSSGTSVGPTTVAGFALPFGANNNSSIVVSFLATTSTKISGSGAASGTLHLDNLSFSATAIPEPSTYAIILGAVALVSIAVHRRRPKAV